MSGQDTQLPRVLSETPKHWSWKLAVAAFAGLAGLIVYIILSQAVFPFASVDLKLSQEQVYAKARHFLKEQGFSSGGYEKSVVFQTCSTDYLQKTLGMKKAIAAVQADVPCWAWEVRYFKELQKEGFYVRVDPTDGEILKFSHRLLEDDEGELISQPGALALAKDFLADQGFDLTRYDLTGDTQVKRENRIDHFFTFKEKDFRIGEAEMKIKVDVQGGRLGYFARFLDIPEQFYRDNYKQSTTGMALMLIFRTVMLFLGLSCLWILLQQYKDNQVNWRLALFMGSLLIPVNIANFFNALPQFWHYLPTTIPKAVYFGLALVMSVLGAVMMGLFVFAVCAAGESLARQQKMPGFSLLNCLRDRTRPLKATIPLYVIGYALGFMMLGYNILFYYIGSRYFHVWWPIEIAYSDPINTSMPFLFPLTVGAVAAVTEELFFRLYAINFFKKYLKKTWLAVLISSVCWAFLHSNYPVFPNYFRGLELTLVGLALSWAYLRYGIEASLIAHFVYNAFLAGEPLLRSGHFHLRVSVLLVLLAVFWPLALIAWKKVSYRYR